MVWEITPNLGESHFSYMNECSGNYFGNNFWPECYRQKCCQKRSAIGAAMLNCNSIASIARSQFQVRRRSFPLCWLPGVHDTIIDGALPLSCGT